MFNTKFYQILKIYKLESYPTLSNFINMQFMQLGVISLHSTPLKHTIRHLNHENLTIISDFISICQKKL